MTKLKSLTLAIALSVGCGSSSEPEQPAQAPVIAPPETVTPKAVRTIVHRPLLAGSAQNLLLDIAFREPGWGHFTTIFDTGYSQVAVASKTLSLSAASVSAPVGIFKDPAATDDKSKGMVSVASFVGGAGPFTARVWISRSTVAGAPAELLDDASEFRASITTGGIPEGKAYDLTRKDEKVVGNRTWVLFEARVEATLPSTAFFNLKFGRRGGAYMVQAPEVIALNLLPPGDTPMAMKVSVPARTVTFEESAAVAYYLRQPHQLVVPRIQGAPMRASKPAR